MDCPGLRHGVLAVLLAAAISLAAPSPLHADILVTEAEAQLPPPTKPAAASRGITRGPRIEVTAPTDTARSPVRLQVRFEAFGGARINLNTLRLMYLKTPLIDLTDRIKPYLQPSGIDMPKAELPPGEHAMRIELSDTEGRNTVANVLLRIAP